MRRIIKIRDPLMLFTNPLARSGSVVRREVLEHDPLDERKEVLGGDDYRLWLRLNRAHELHFLPAKLLYYRVHQGQMSHRYVEMLDRWDEILRSEEHALITEYGINALRTARGLIEVRRRYVQGDNLGATLKALRVVACATSVQRRTLIEYLRYGLLQRLKSRLRGDSRWRTVRETQRSS
jgi:hypothetical protein